MRFSRPTVLMCPPEHYGIYYEINPWMNRQRQADHQLAVQQWESLRSVLAEVGAEIVQLPPAEGLPDLVFTANAAIVYRQIAVLSRFRHPQRQGETDRDETWFREAGFQVEHLPDGFFFEGAGDALFCGDTLFAGYRIRSDVRAHQWLGDRFSCRVIPMELVDAYFYHLDTCFCPLAPGMAIVYLGAFDAYGRTVLAELLDDMIVLNDQEARAFAANAVVVGKTVITNAGCPLLHRQLRNRGFEPVATPLGEFVKAGGSAKCLTLRLDGEEAAAWKRLEA